MIWFILGLAVGVTAKTLLPWPYLDDHVRSVWRWGWSKIP